MPRRWLSVFWLIVATSGAAMAAVPSAWPNISRAPTAADRAIMVQDWAGARDALAKALAENYKPGVRSSPGSTGQNLYKSWLLLWKWCDLLSRDQVAEANRFVLRRMVLPNGAYATHVPAGLALPTGQSPTMLKVMELSLSPTAIRDAGLLPRSVELPQKSPLANSVPGEILAEWTADPAFLQLLFHNLSPDDYAPGVLSNLTRIRMFEPKKFREYSALAVAIAVVYDQKPPVFWPHRQVEHALVPLVERRPEETFALWAKANDSPRQLMDLRTLTPQQLKFVVDAPVRETEFDWARENIRTPLRDLAKVFTSIHYVKQRVTLGDFVWDTGPYTLSGIQLRGGICVDQAYFAMVSGKARGVPTLYFSGAGNNWRHAWFGYLLNKDKWELDCGRYENQGFVTGNALDPQTWTPINDHELEFLVENFRTRPEFAASRDDGALADILEARGNFPLAAKALDSAIAVCPRNADAWDAKTAFLERNHAATAALRAHHEAAIRQFSNVPDVKTSHQTALAALALAQGDATAAQALERQMATQNADTRADLVVDVVAGKMSTLLAAKNYPAALREYSQQVTETGARAPLTFLRKVTTPLVVALADAGDTAHARELLVQTRAAFKPPKNSQLEENLAALENAVAQTAAVSRRGL